jgi:hypothetical protein
MVHATQIAQIVPAMIVASLWLVTAGNAERQMQLQEVQEDSYPFITEIPAPDAAELAVSEAARLVAVRYHGKNADQVSIFSLDKTGALTGAQPISLVLPKRELAEHPNYALGLTFHPSLPLLYVWQDVTVPDDADARTFEHLLAFRIADGKAELAQACGKGSDYAIGRKLGYVAVDRKATRLFFPNLEHKKNDKWINGVGYFALGEDGLVLAAEGTADPGHFVPQRETEFADFIASDKAGGFLPVADDVIIFAGVAGPISWDLVEARQRLTMYCAHPPSRNNRRIGAHPTRPVVYMSFTLCEEPDCVHPIFVMRLKHAEGYITSDFQLTNIYGPLTPPVVLGRRQMVACGGKSQVHLISIDAEGNLLPEVRRAKVGNNEITALSYSDEFDKLYVAVERKR